MSVDLTSTNTNEYRAGLNSGPQGDDSEDLGTVDLFGDFEAMDGGDGVGMATPRSTVSTVTPTATPGAMTTMTPLTPEQRTKPTSTTQAQTHGRKTHAQTSDAWNDFEELFHIVNGKRTRYGAKCNYYKKVLTA
jgi:hypothetical protein